MTLQGKTAIVTGASRGIGRAITETFVREGARVFICGRKQETLDTVAADLRATPAQVALAWLMAQPGVTAPIASATSTPQLQELMGAVTLQLSAAHAALLDSASK